MHRLSTHDACCSAVRSTWLRTFEELKAIYGTMVDELSSRVDEVKLEFGEALAINELLTRVFELKKARHDDEECFHLNQPQFSSFLPLMHAHLINVCVGAADIAV